jgi:hypothetical protein
LERVRAETLNVIWAANTIKDIDRKLIFGTLFKLSLFSLVNVGKSLNGAIIRTFDTIQSGNTEFHIAIEDLLIVDY